MLPRRCLLLKGMFRSLCQPTNTINRHKLTGTTTRNADIMKRFCSTNLEDGPKSTDDNTDRKLKLIEWEMAHLRDRGDKVPETSFLKPQHWDELLKFTSPSARRKYYNFLFVTERKKENEKVKKQERARSYQAYKEMDVKEENPHISYTLANTSMFLRISDRTINLWRNNRLRRAMQFGDKIIYDCSYDQYMTQQESNNAAKQLMLTFAANRDNKDPFDLHFCNVNYSGNTFKRLARFIPNIRNVEYPLNLHERSYMDLFPKEKLVYLTPHCRNDLTEYDPESIYIVGAMVDTNNHEPLSLMKAKELNLKMARLPLDRYCNWGANSGKTLTLDQMMKIMLDLKTHRSWETAFKNVPRRKIFNDEFNEQKEVKKWTASVSKFKNYVGNDTKNFDNDPNGTRQVKNSGLSTAEKFNRKIGTPTSKLSNKFTKNVDSNFDFVDRNDDSTMSTADKFSRKSNRIGSKNTKTGINVKELLVDPKKLK